MLARLSCWKALFAATTLVISASNVHIWRDLTTHFIQLHGKLEDSFNEQLAAEWSNALVIVCMTVVCLAGPKKAKSNPTDPPGSGDHSRQQSSIPSKSAADVSRHNLGNHPSAVKKQGSSAANKQLLPATGIRGQLRQATSLNAAASTQLSIATMKSNQSREKIMDSSPRGSRHIANSDSSVNQKMRLDPASTSGSPESRTERLKKRVLTGGQATTFTQSSAAGDQPQKGVFTHSSGSQSPLHLSPHLDKLGTRSSLPLLVSLLCLPHKDALAS